MVETVPLRANQREQTREERLEILRMLETGAISVDEAASLLDALDRVTLPGMSGGSTAPPTAGARQIRFRVTDSTTGKAVVNLAFPLGLIESGLDIAAQFVPDYLPRAEAIQETVRAGFRGSLVDVDDGGERVEIIVE